MKSKFCLVLLFPAALIFPALLIAMAVGCLLLMPLDLLTRQRPQRSYYL